MKEYISLDAHKRYSLAEREDIASGQTRQTRIEHHRGAIAAYLAEVERDTPVAVEATGNWYWIVEEIERAGCVPRLVHPRKAKLMFGCINKTDKLDVHGLNRLQRTGTLPTVWIAPGATRDLRELPRTRMFFSQQRARLKNRIQANLAKYGLVVEDCSDVFGRRGRQQLQVVILQLPPNTRGATEALLSQLDAVAGQIAEQERQIRELIAVTPGMQRLHTLPGVGDILSVVLALEIGEVTRFATPERLASYAGTTPRVHASGDKMRFGRLRPDVNRYLKWAFVEAANCVCIQHRRHPEAHVSRLYRRVAQRRGHAKAIGAVARHLAEAAFHVLSRNEDYKEPERTKGDSSKGNASATAA